MVNGINYTIAINVGCPTDCRIDRHTDDYATKQLKVFGIDFAIVVDVAPLIVLPHIIIIFKRNNPIEVAPQRRLLIQTQRFSRDMQSATLLVGK